MNNMILQLLLFLCSATPTLLALAGPGESDSQVDAAASSKFAPRASTTILPFEANTNTATAEESTKAKTRESDSLQAADSSGLTPTMQSTAAKKIIKTTEDGITSPSSSSSSPTSILSKIHPLLLIKAIDAIRRDRVKSWTRSSNRRLKECWDTFIWTSKSGKGKAGKSDKEEEDASFLYVQMADQCTFELGSDGTYRFYSSDFLANTYQFTDMPFKEERKLPTGEFFSDFHTVYFRDNEHPNTAFTLVDEDNSDGVVVSALASAFVEYPKGEQGTPLYGFVLDQSESQASARSLSDVLDGGNEKTHDHCSIFVDNGSGSPAEKQCFRFRAELKGAVEMYVSSGCNEGDSVNDVCQDITDKYGWPMNSWCVDKVTDMSELFHEMSTFNEVISSWDVSQVTDMSGMFKGAYSFNQDLSPWVVSQVKDMSRMFQDAWSFNQDFYSWGLWDVSKVQDMSYMFYGATSFNQDISFWDVSQVQDMSWMFAEASSFNGNISLWDVSQVHDDMSYMFYGASSFNHDLSLWDIRQVQDMALMFYDASSFSQDLCAWADKNFPYNNAQYIFTNSGCRHQSDPQQERGGPFCASDCCSYEHFATRDKLKGAVDTYVSSGCNEGADVNYFCQDITSKYGWPMNSWCVDKVTDMSDLFNEMETFNDDISSWDVSQVQDMRGMFYGASKFNQDLSSWDVSQVQSMNAMFNSAFSFNQDLSLWNVSQVQRMDGMFQYATSFNQDLSSWNVSQVQDMSYMFAEASSFNGDVSSWDIRQVQDVRSMFISAGSFNQNLCAWASKNFPYAYASFIFTNSGCEYQDTPSDQGGPFCATYCD